MSLGRALSKLGWCSRAQARRLVAAGRVTVDGRTVLNPDQRVDVRRARIAVDGENVRAARNVYLMMHKPRGLVTTTSDERGRRTVYELLPEDAPRVVAVGRLDMDSEGLLLFTNDTRWADRLLDPGRHVDKVYHVHVRGVVSPSMLERMMSGVQTRGEKLRVKVVRPLPERGGDWLEVVLDEGKNRQIRRILEASGLRIEQLIRMSIGPVTLGDLAAGATRALSDTEKAQLDALIA